jgi:hypothetical protein
LTAQSTGKVLSCFSMIPRTAAKMIARFFLHGIKPRLCTLAWRTEGLEMGDAGLQTALFCAPVLRKHVFAAARPIYNPVYFDGKQNPHLQSIAPSVLLNNRSENRFG